jgi:hypothetical protein
MRAKTRSIIKLYDFFSVFSTIFQFSGYSETDKNRKLNSSHRLFHPNISKCPSVREIVSIVRSMSVMFKPEQ